MNNLKITDFIETDFLQELQNLFAKTMGFASLTYDDKKPITEPTNFSNFCQNYIRKNKTTAKRCEKCDLKYGKLAAEKQVPIIYTCHAGLTDFVVPIIVEGKHLGSIYGGQILTEQANQQHFKEIAKEIGADENEFFKALKEVRVVPKENIQKAAELLHLVANTVSTVGLKNLELVKINKREALLKNILEKVRNTFDIEEIFNFICEETVKLFNVQRATIVHFYDKENYENYVIKREYKTIPIKGLDSSEYTPKAAAFWNYKVLQTGEVLAFNNIQESESPDYFKKCYNALGVKSMIGAPIKRDELQWGTLVLSEYNKYRTWSDEEKNLLETISAQICIAIRQAELFSEVEKNEKYKRIILENIKDGIIIIDENFKIQSVNPAVTKMWGYKESELINSSLDILIMHECTKIDDKTCLTQTENNGIRKNGEEFPIEIETSEINFEESTLLLIAVRDITEQRKIDKMKNEFVSTVSHELRTPLTSIKGSLGLVKSEILGKLPQKALELIVIADNNCTRLTNIINDILDIEKIKAGKFEFKLEEIEINSLIEHAIILNQSYADQFGIKIVLKKFKEKLFIKADRNRLLQVIANLFSNAVKFSKQDGTVTIKITKQKGYLKIAFVDKGIGIADEAKGKIFQSFSQVDSSDSRAKGGTGLGLSICKLIINQMGGRIDFITEENKGSTFFFEFPLTKN